jgi:hypothetical protein
VLGITVASVPTGRANQDAKGFVTEGRESATNQKTMPSNNQANKDQMINLAIVVPLEVCIKAENIFSTSTRILAPNIGEIVEMQVQTQKAIGRKKAGNKSKIKMASPAINKKLPPTPTTDEDSRPKYARNRPKKPTTISKSNNLSTNRVAKEVAALIDSLLLNPNARNKSPARKGRTLLAATLAINGPAQLDHVRLGFS